MQRGDIRAALFASLNANKSLSFYLILTSAKSLAKLIFYNKLYNYLKIFCVIRIVLLIVMCGVFLVDTNYIFKIFHALATIIVYEIINKHEIFGKELYKRLGIFWRGIYTESISLRECEKLCYNETVENYCDLLFKIDVVTTWEPVHSRMEKLELSTYEMRAIHDFLSQEISKSRMSV